MRVLMFHNRYREQGGEDLSVTQETQALEQEGVEVIPVEADNDLPADAGLLSEAKMGWHAVWSLSSYEHAARLCRKYRPDVAHVQNFWMRLSPAVHAACRQAGVATVQSAQKLPPAVYQRAAVAQRRSLRRLRWQDSLARRRAGVLPRLPGRFSGRGRNDRH